MNDCISMKNCLVIGGSNGIGLSISLQLAKRARMVTIVDLVRPDITLPMNVSYYAFNLLNNNFSFLNEYKDIDTLVITAGFGRVTLFGDIHSKEIDNSFQVNAISVMHIL